MPIPKELYEQLLDIEVEVTRDYEHGTRDQNKAFIGRLKKGDPSGDDRTRNIFYFRYGEGDWDRPSDVTLVNPTNMWPDSLFD